MFGTRAIGAALRITLSSIASRWSMAVSTLAGIMLVVMVLLGFFSMAEGFSKALTSAGSTDVAVIVGRNVRSESVGILSPDTVQTTEAHLVNAGIDPDALSPEYVRVVPFTQSDGSSGSLVVRGVGPNATGLRPQRVSTDSRRLPTPGPGEVVLGRAAATRLAVDRAGETVTFAGQQWRVTAIAKADGSALESEAWVEGSALRAAFPDHPGLQSLRFRLPDAATLARLKTAMGDDPRLSVDVMREDALYAAQSSGLSGMLRSLAWPLAITIALGALAGALNTMYSSVASRSAEIATLRAIGFQPAAIFFSTLAEALTLAALGALLGAGLSLLLFDGRSGSTLAGGAAQVNFTFLLSPEALLTAFLFAMVIGLLGGAPPAFRAARQPILVGLNGGSQ